MEIANLTVKQLEHMFAAGKANEELIEACRSDKRSTVARLVRKWEAQEKEKERLAIMNKYEMEARSEGLDIVAGVDEAGRGPLAGPVSIAAVILPSDCQIAKINDSKKISHTLRDKLYDEIMAKAICVRQIFVDAQTIDRVNILQATMNGMYDAVFALDPVPKKVLIDAVELPSLPMPSLSLIKGDAKSASIAAASIIAKVARDRLMEEYDAKYPQYGFALHKGYGTAQHIKAIREHGPCPIHRRSFEPIKSMIANFE